MKKKWFYPLLVIMTLASILAQYFTQIEWLKFTLAAFSLLLWAALLGKSTESVAYYAGERLGGLLNATFGNAAELIIGIFLVKEGLFNLVKASIIGSIIGNLLLVLGLSVFFGGLKYKTQKFNSMLASHNTSLMLIAVIALFIPAAFLKQEPLEDVLDVSIIISAVLMIGYFLWLYFSLVTHRQELNSSSSNQPIEDEKENPPWSKWISILILAISTLFVAVQSEWLVHSVEAVAKAIGWSELFVGAFLIAIIGNAAEHSAAIMLAIKNRLDAAVEIAVGSSLQISLFVAPVLVFVGLMFGKKMDLVFNSYEIVAVTAATFIASSISRDGATNWYEGVLLLMVYVILGAAFFVVG
ncbi:calcium/proton exchanger [Thermoflavimicrobium daqui]|uniref:Ca(2+)/H(+) antiporter n=1 Tax=Thermoflavimicrobium daqui TaxID=2137476 RepID=A0A364K5U7_9BACL|nr:calcium/proton exchanger [Thermoflavimicrobium daqui]RAL25674.1 calcium/proton exchanger [Thermoflavimicrobium daqui]